MVDGRLSNWGSAIVCTGGIMSATFTATPVIWISIEDRSKGSDLGYRFMDWLHDSHIDPVATSVRFPWCYVAGFAPDDAERVVAWLRENGCVQERSG